MKNKFTILGCGSSLGTPWINDNWGKCKKKNKNIRTRCCAHLQHGNISILIDTSPDIKSQLIKNKIKKIDSIIFTHFHSDQVAGIFEFRPFYWSNKKKISVYADKVTSKHLLKKYKFPNLETKEDYVLWLKLSKNIELKGLNKILAYCRKLDNSLSSSTFQKIKNAFLVYYKYLNFNILKSFFLVLNLSINFVKKRYL